MDYDFLAVSYFLSIYLNKQRPGDKLLHQRMVVWTTNALIHSSPIC